MGSTSSEAALFFKAQKIHFIGIGGIGMSGIAEILLSLGAYQISGSDLRRSPVTERLRKLGAQVWEGHRAENVHGADVVVTSSAVGRDNPEILEAQRLQLPVISRGEMLAELMRLKYGIAVAGSHGKTTTTSMIAAILQHAGLDPTVVVGGRVGAIGSSARLGSGNIMVVESDESDGSFLHLAPIIAVITTIDREHLDHYADLEAIKDAYVQFAQRVPFYGAVIADLEEPNIQAILPRLNKRLLTYGASPQADLVAVEIACGAFRGEFRLKFRGRDLGTFRVNVPGRHNVSNAMAAALVGLERDLSPDQIRHGLASFAGVDRRFQVRGVARGVTVIDDYGHHPTEIRATLAAAADCGFRRVLVLFQPHRYTRTKLLLDDFARCFHQCDRLWIMDIYAASEPKIEGVTAEALVEKVRLFGRRAVEYAPEAEAALGQIALAAEEGDAVVLLGAGSVNQLAEPLLERLAAQATATQS
jgi:UDP-N-acetylmuramate--alanine ligase